MGQQQQRPSSNFIRTVTLERLAIGIIPLMVVYNIALMIIGLLHHIAIPASIMQLDVDLLEWLVTPLIVGLAGQNALGSLWGGGMGGYGGGYGGGINIGIDQTGTMGSGLQTQNQPVGTPPAGQ